MAVKRSAPQELRVFFRLAFVASWGIGGVGVLIDRAIPRANALSTASPLYYLAARMPLASLGFCSPRIAPDSPAFAAWHTVLFRGEPMRGHILPC